MKRTKAEEAVNALTHLCWFFFAFVCLMWSATYGHNALILHSFGAMIAALGSAIYHEHDSDDVIGKHAMLKLDKLGIFIFMGMVSMSFGLALNSTWRHLPSMMMAASFILAILYAMNIVKESKSEICHMMLAFGILLSILHAGHSWQPSWQALMLFGQGLTFYAIGYWCYKKDAELKWMHSFWHAFVMMGWAAHSLTIFELTR